MRSGATAVAGRCGGTSAARKRRRLRDSTTGDTRLAHRGAQHRATPTNAGTASSRKTLPSSAAETYTAHATADSAVQSNGVYLTPCNAVPSVSFRAP